MADHELVDLVAAELGTEGSALELLDEEQSNWIRDVLGDFMPGEIINRDSYVSHLGKVVKLLAMRGRIVLFGHGAPCFLPRDRGLRLRIVAPLEDRTRRLAQEERVGEDRARALITELERSHAAFVSHYFAQDVSSPDMYDLILNSGFLTVDGMVRVALEGAHQAGMDAHSQRSATSGA
jgi:cytidylate kinase